MGRYSDASRCRPLGLQNLTGANLKALFDSAQSKLIYFDARESRDARLRPPLIFFSLERSLLLNLTKLICKRIIKLQICQEKTL